MKYLIYAIIEKTRVTIHISREDGYADEYTGQVESYAAAEARLKAAGVEYTLIDHEPQ